MRRLLIFLIYLNFIQGEKQCHPSSPFCQNDQPNSNACSQTTECFLPFTSCQKNQCACINGYQFVENQCRPSYGLLVGSECENHQQCTIEFSRCVESTCQCIEGYKLVDNECQLENGKYNDQCIYQNDCKGRFTSCNLYKKCECISGYFPQGQNCVPYDVGNNVCEFSFDCNRKFTICEEGHCVCADGFYLQGQECVPLKGALGEVCSTNNDCAIPNSHCFNGRCQCTSNYYNQGYDCVPSNYYELGVSCSSDDQCPIVNSLCHTNQCFCMNGYRQMGYECVYNGEPRLKRQSNSDYQNAQPVKLGSYCNVDNDCGNTVFNCEPHSKRCVCRYGFIPYNDNCRFVGNIQPPHLGNQPPHTPPYPLPPKLIDNNDNGDDSQHQLTYEVRFPANPDNVYSGALGHRCSSSADCSLPYLYCNPVSYACECLKSFHFDGIDCVRTIKLNLKPGYSTVSTSGTRTLYHSHGATCYEDADCYSETLLCDIHSYKCVCSPVARLDGEYCIIEEVHKPTVNYYKLKQGTVQTPNRRQYHPGTNSNPIPPNFHYPPAPPFPRPGSQYPPNAQYPPPNSQYPPPNAQYPPPNAQYPPPNSQYPPPNAQYPPPNAQYPPPNAQYPPPNVQHPPPNAQYPPPNSQYPPPNAQYPPPNSQYPPPNAQYPPPNVQHPPPNAQYPPPNSQYPPPNSQHPPPNSQHPPPESRFLPPNSQHPPPESRFLPSDFLFSPPAPFSPHFPSTRGSPFRSPSVPYSYAMYPQQLPSFHSSSPNFPPAPAYPPAVPSHHASVPNPPIIPRGPHFPNKPPEDDLSSAKTGKHCQSNHDCKSPFMHCRGSECFCNYGYIYSGGTCVSKGYSRQ